MRSKSQVDSSWIVLKWKNNVLYQRFHWHKLDLILNPRFSKCSQTFEPHCIYSYMTRISYFPLPIWGKQCSQFYYLFEPLYTCQSLAMHSDFVPCIFISLSQCQKKVDAWSSGVEWDTKSQVTQRQQLTALSKKIPLNTNWIARC